MELLFQRKAELLLACRRRFPKQVRRFCCWAKMRLRMSMTGETPTHTEGFLMFNDPHLVDLAMAAHATDATVDMQGMIEEGVVWQAMHAFPFDGEAFVKTRTHFGEQRAGGFNCAVTIHADLCVRNGGVRRLLDVRMTVNTRHAQRTGVKFMRKWHWLFGRVAYPSELRSQGAPRRGCQKCDGKYATGENLPEQAIRVWLKDHSHLTTSASFSSVRLEFNMRQAFGFEIA
jgi:hypothetical protein